jgi:hypothetical protein
MSNDTFDFCNTALRVLYSREIEPLENSVRRVGLPGTIAAHAHAAGRRGAAHADV